MGKRRMRFYFCVAAAFAGGCAVQSDDVSSEEGDVGVAMQAEVIDCPYGDSQIQEVNVSKELIIRDVKVVNDTISASDSLADRCRTSWNLSACPVDDRRNRWHFWHIMSQMAGGNNVSRFVLKWLESFEEEQVVNGHTLSPRVNIRTKIINPWRAASTCAQGTTKVDTDNCQLRPERAPFRLLAIVNRMDLRTSDPSNPYGGGSSGEGRLVFGFTNVPSSDNATSATALEATVVFEYKLPTFDPFFFTNFGRPTTFEWAHQWHGLATLADEAYNSGLQQITDQFLSSGADELGPNFGSAISQVRTNDRDFDVDDDPTVSGDTRQWSLREFKLGCLPSGPCDFNSFHLVPVPVAQTPRNIHNRTTILDNYLNTNAGSDAEGSKSGILGERHTVPLFFDSQPFQAAEALSHPLLGGSDGPFVWDKLNDLAPVGGVDRYDDTRRLFALATCNGCHYFETQTNFTHIGKRSHSQVAPLSSFLSTDPLDTTGLSTPFSDSNGVEVTFNEPRRRVCEFLWTLDGNSQPLSTTAGRVH